MSLKGVAGSVEGVEEEADGDGDAGSSSSVSSKLNSSVTFHLKYKHRVQSSV